MPVRKFWQESDAIASPGALGKLGLRADGDPVRHVESLAHEEKRLHFRRRWLDAGWFSLLDSSVVLLAIDRARGTVFLAVDFPAFGLSQRATVGRAVVVDFSVDVSFAAFHASGFGSGQLTALHALGNSFLLIALTLPHFALGIHVLHLGIVLLVVDVLGKLVLLLVQGGAIGSGQVTVV